MSRGVWVSIGCSVSIKTRREALQGCVELLDQGIQRSDQGYQLVNGYLRPLSPAGPPVQPPPVSPLGGISPLDPEPTIVSASSGTVASSSSADPPSRAPSAQGQSEGLISSAFLNAPHAPGPIFGPQPPRK